VVRCKKATWEKAHQLIQDLTDKNAAWIHAYLHRKEGDVWNADYWYRKAGKQRPGRFVAGRMGKPCGGVPVKAAFAPQHGDLKKDF
jgi:hypothetical protein